MMGLKHQGIEGNERADQLAASKRAKTPFVWPELVCALSKAYFKQEPKKTIRLAQPKGHRQTKDVLGYFNRKSSVFLVRPNKIINLSELSGFHRTRPKILHVEVHLRSASVIYIGCSKLKNRVRTC